MTQSWITGAPTGPCLHLILDRGRRRRRGRPPRVARSRAPVRVAGHRGPPRGNGLGSQIENALRSKLLQHFVIAVTPAALASPVVRREIRLARQEGKTVSPGLCVLPDGRLASGSGDNVIRLWDVTTGAETARLNGQVHWVDALCVLPDGRLASGSQDTTIRLWDVKTGAETARLNRQVHWVDALCVLPDGRLASGCHDKTIRLWDVKTSAETARLEGSSAWVHALCVLPDGRLASVSRDKTIRLWDTAAQNDITPLEVDAETTCVAPLPNGRGGKHACVPTGGD
jgi:WD40 repeat protein